MNLDGKRVLITDGGSGIGLELARRLAERSRTRSSKACVVTARRFALHRYAGSSR
jgi:short-subunit dehydrogenase involved in D-alanine esterification of teichoic acids